MEKYRKVSSRTQSIFITLSLPKTLAHFTDIQQVLDKLCKMLFLVSLRSIPTSDEKLQPACFSELFKSWCKWEILKINPFDHENPHVVEYE